MESKEVKQTWIANANLIVSAPETATKLEAANQEIERLKAEKAQLDLRNELEAKANVPGYTRANND